MTAAMPPSRGLDARPVQTSICKMPAVRRRAFAKRTISTGTRTCKFAVRYKTVAAES